MRTMEIMPELHPRCGPAAAEPLLSDPVSIRHGTHRAQLGMTELGQPADYPDL